MATSCGTSDGSNRDSTGLGGVVKNDVGKYWDDERRQEEAYMEMSDRASQKRYERLGEEDD